MRVDFQISIPELREAICAWMQEIHGLTIRHELVKFSAFSDGAVFVFSLDTSPPSVLSSVYPERGWVYVVKSSSGFYKIGQTTNVKSRITGLKNGHPYSLTLMHSVETTYADSFLLEKHLHEQYSEKRKTGEWFALDDTDVEEIQEITGWQSEEIQPNAI